MMTWKRTKMSEAHDDEQREEVDNDL